jgi:hypothetical protein
MGFASRASAPWGRSVVGAGQGVDPLLKRLRRFGRCWLHALPLAHQRSDRLQPAEDRGPTVAASSFADCAVVRKASLPDLITYDNRRRSARSRASSQIKEQSRLLVANIPAMSKIVAFSPCYRNINSFSCLLSIVALYEILPQNLTDG